MRRPPSAIGRPQALRNDPLAAERARVFEDARAVSAERLIERDAVVRKAQQARQPTLALLDRLRPNVLAVHLKQVERAEDSPGIGAVAADEVKHGKPVVVANDGFGVDDARPDGQGLDRRCGEREAVRQVVITARDQADAAPAPTRP
jgi:hypothetical protein